MSDWSKTPPTDELWTSWLADMERLSGLKPIATWADREKAARLLYLADAATPDRLNLTRHPERWARLAATKVWEEAKEVRGWVILHVAEEIAREREEHERDVGRALASLLGDVLTRAETVIGDPLKFEPEEAPGVRIVHAVNALTLRIAGLEAALVAAKREHCDCGKGNGFVELNLATGAMCTGIEEHCTCGAAAHNAAIDAALARTS